MTSVPWRCKEATLFAERRQKKELYRKKVSQTPGAGDRQEESQEQKQAERAGEVK